MDQAAYKAVRHVVALIRSLGGRLAGLAAHGEVTRVEVVFLELLTRQGVLFQEESVNESDLVKSERRRTSGSGRSTTSLLVNEMSDSLTHGVFSQPLSIPLQYLSQNLCKSSELCLCIQSVSNC